MQEGQVEFFLLAAKDGISRFIARHLELINYYLHGLIRETMGDAIDARFRVISGLDFRTIPVLPGHSSM